MHIISNNFKDKMSRPFDLPAIEVITFQCSPLSTSDGIAKIFHRAKKYQDSVNEGKRNSELFVTVLLDEIGLAEYSPNLPLKVLHKLLEEPDVSFVGISNWALDPGNTATLSRNRL
jgi:hypothetical protein